MFVFESLKDETPLVFRILGADQTNPDQSVTRGWVYNEGWSPRVGTWERYVKSFFYSVTNFAPEVAHTSSECLYATLQHVIY